MEVGKIFSSISAIMDEVGAIGKTKKNQQQGFMYRGIDDVMNCLQPLLAKHKVFIVPQVLEQHREERQTQKGGTLFYSIFKIKYTFYAEDGSSVESITVGEAMDSGDKGSNKSMAIAFKYACFQVFCIPTEEMQDPDGQTPEPVKPKEYKCTDCNKPFESFTDSKGKSWNAGQVYHMAENKNPDKKARCKACREKIEMEQPE